MIVAPEDSRAKKSVCMTTERTATRVMQVSLAHDDTRRGDELGQRAVGMAWVTEGDGGPLGRRVLRSAPVAVNGNGCQGGVAEGREVLHRASASRVSGTIVGPDGGGNGVRVTGRLTAGQGVGSRIEHCAAVCDMGWGSDQCDGLDTMAVSRLPSATRSNPDRSCDHSTRAGGLANDGVVQRFGDVGRRAGLGGLGEVGDSVRWASGSAGGWIPVILTR